MNRVRGTCRCTSSPIRTSKHSTTCALKHHRSSCVKHLGLYLWWLGRDIFSIKVNRDLFQLPRGLILLLYDSDQSSVITQSLISDAEVLAGVAILRLVNLLEGSVFEESCGLLLLLSQDLHEVLRLELQVYGLLRQGIHGALEPETHRFKRSLAHDLSLKD